MSCLEKIIRINYNGKGEEYFGSLQPVTKSSVHSHTDFPQEMLVIYLFSPAVPPLRHDFVGGRPPPAVLHGRERGDVFVRGGLPQAGGEAAPRRGGRHAAHQLPGEENSGKKNISLVLFAGKLRILPFELSI